jgi:ATPase subunit of ABC transporter with duplicated ATPase domains
VLHFALEENDRLGIIGVNGSGKSSLFKCIMGEYEPEEGSISIAGGKSVAILSQTGAFEDGCGMEDVLPTSDGGLRVIETMTRAFPELLSMEARLDELQRALAARILKEQLSVRQTEQLAARLAKQTPSRGPTPAPAVDYYQLAADRLGQSMGRRVRITEGRKTGKIELEFYGADDREALLQALESIGKLKRV